MISASRIIADMKHLRIYCEVAPASDGQKELCDAQNALQDRKNEFGPKLPKAEASCLHRYGGANCRNLRRSAMPSCRGTDFSKRNGHEGCPCH